MADMEQLSIALAPDMAAELRAAVAEGEYANVGEAVHEALLDWHLRRRPHLSPAEDLRRQVQDGIDSGPGLKASDVFDRLRTKFGSPPAV